MTVPPQSPWPWLSIIAVAVWIAYDGLALPRMASRRPPSSAASVDIPRNVRRYSLYGAILEVVSNLAVIPVVFYTWVHVGPHVPSVDHPAIPYAVAVLIAVILGRITWAAMRIGRPIHKDLNLRWSIFLLCGIVGCMMILPLI